MEWLVAVTATWLAYGAAPLAQCRNEPFPCPRPRRGLRGSRALYPGVLGRPLPVGRRVRPDLERAAEPAARGVGREPRAGRGAGGGLRRGRRRHLAGPARLDRHRGGRVGGGAGAGGGLRGRGGRGGRAADHLAARGPLVL